MSSSPATAAYALLSIWEMDGALVVYDMATLDEVKRIPMVKPSGKYNVWNKISPRTKAPATKPDAGWR